MQKTTRTNKPSFGNKSTNLRSSNLISCFLQMKTYTTCKLSLYKLCIDLLAIETVHFFNRILQINPTIWFPGVQPANNASRKHHSRLLTLTSILYGQRPNISSHSEPAGNKEGRNEQLHKSMPKKAYDVAYTPKPVLAFAVCSDNGFSRIQHFQLTKKH
ncbi:hypothetical protein H5410_040892 [Solanum commersonii]|uniref:Uncharacterized protein n=1 Tax=Solanum commersonii TaxID=4109 RepID=A0A9J5XRG6_SOLCO|nr:hypothetical protein H5410_040892 [Solanum commersonii]